MTISIATETGQSARPTLHRRSTTTAVPELRPGRGSGRRGGPSARPARRVAAPRLAPAIRRPIRSCSVPAAQSNWRLTDRALALIMVTGLMIVAAAVVVVGLTAVRVTGDGYRPDVSQFAQR